MTPPPTVLEDWLAREVLTAEVLAAVAHDEIATARSTLSSSGRGAYCAERQWQVEGPRVAYRHPVHGSGTVTVRRLVDLAVAARTEAGCARLRATYRAYVIEAVEGRVAFPRDWDAEPEQLAAARAHVERYAVASRALDDARHAWWSSLTVQVDLFEGEAAA